jgi:enoyl-CoA hydratase/carnithine racemase
MGTVLALGTFLCFLFKLFLMPALLSLMNDWVIPFAQLMLMINPHSWRSRQLRRGIGRWLRSFPDPDHGFTTESTSDGIMIFSYRRPPLNMIDAAMACKSYAMGRIVDQHPEYQALIFRSDLPAYFHIHDQAGRLVLDANGKPARLPATLAETSPRLPLGHQLVGPIRPFGAGADLVQMAKSPLNALVLLRMARVTSELTWYMSKPSVIIAEGDLVGGWFECALYFNYFIVTKHARIGAPEVKRGLTLPYGAHALALRAGTAVAQRLMSTGEFINGEEAVELGVADALVPDGKDPVQYALELCRTQEFRDRIQQISILHQYEPPIGPLLAKSLRNYVRMLRSRSARERIARFVAKEIDA